MNPMVDGWMGDDWFHNGAFRQQMMPLRLRARTADPQGRREVVGRGHSTTTTRSCEAGSAGELGAPPRAWTSSASGGSCSSIPTYDAYLARPGASTGCSPQQPLEVPTLIVHSLWDQEDIYGAIAVYEAIEPKDTANDKVFLVLGPWYHGQSIRDGSSPRRDRVRQRHRRAGSAAKCCCPFLDQYLKDGAPTADVAPVIAFETGTNQWRRLDAWPAGCRRGVLANRHRSISAPVAKPASAAPARGDAGVRRVCLRSRPSRCRIARGRSARTGRRVDLAAAGWSTISATPPTAPTCSPSSPSR